MKKPKLCDGCGSEGRRQDDIQHLPHCPVVYGHPIQTRRIASAVRLKETVKVLTDSICDGRKTPAEIATALLAASLALGNVRDALAEELSHVQLVEG